LIAPKSQQQSEQTATPDNFRGVRSWLIPDFAMET